MILGTVIGTLIVTVCCKLLFLDIIIRYSKIVVPT